MLYFATRVEAVPLVDSHGIGGGDPVNLAATHDLALAFAYVSDFLLAGNQPADIALFVVDVAQLEDGKLSQYVEGAWLGEGCYAYKGEIPASALTLERVIVMASEAVDSVDRDVWGEIEALL